MEVQGQVLESRTWASVQRSAQDEVLNIWMKTPKGKVPKLSFSKADSDSESASRQAENTDDESNLDRGSSISAPAEPAEPAVFERLDVVPVISAFFEWRILDEFGDPDGCPLDEKLNRFLNAIYRSLPAAATGGANEPLNVNRRAKQETRHGTVPRTKILVDGKTQSEVRRLVHDISLSRSGSDAPIALKLCGACERLFRYFLPGTHDEQSAPIHLFWGAIHEIMVRVSGGFVTWSRWRILTIAL